MIMVEYQCDACGELFESLEPRPAPPHLPCRRCGRPAPRVLSAVKGKVCWAWVDRGRVEPRPPGVLNTEPPE